MLRQVCPVPREKLINIMTPAVFVRPAQRSVPVITASQSERAAGHANYTQCPPPPRDRKDQTHYESLNQKHEKRWKKKAEAERPPPPPPRRAETRFGESIHPSSAYCSTNTERGAAAGGERSFILTKKTSSFYPEVFVSARLFSLT